MTDAATAADDDTSSDPGTGPAELARLDLYRYATADDPVVRAQYLAIMRLFSETLLTDLAASEVAEQLTARGEPVTVEDVEARCERLEAWGNLIRSVRDSRVATVADYLRSRSRYQVSKLGGRVHRQVDELLRATTGVRDVARELLGGMVDTLDRIVDRITDASGAEPDAEAIAADVTTVFASQQLFTDSVADFYAYLNQVLSRYDLAGEEYAGFKELLLTYVDLITADVARHAPAVMGKLAVLERHLDALLAVLDTLPTLTNPDGSPAERSPGRARSDWEEFAAWYTGHAGRSGPAQLRTAAEQALAQLLANAKRMLAAAGTGVSRRTDLLRLAGWFAEAGPEEAHRLFAAAFGAYPARHVVLGPEEITGRGAGEATTSWFDADPVPVPVSLRERGDRAARGRTSRVPDPSAERELLRAEAEADAARDRAAAAELVAAGRLGGAQLTPAARDLVLDRLGEMFAAGQDVTEALAWTDDDLGFVLRAEPTPGKATVIAAPDGELHVHGLTLTVVPFAASRGTGSEG
ncbi:TIGR02677 family protein [Geodermatophilus sp. SYSU D00815]